MNNATETGPADSTEHVPAVSPDDGRRLRISCYAVLLALSAGWQLTALCHTEPLQSANDRSRWATVWSLVERGTWTIDEIQQRPGWRTIDRVRFAPTIIDDDFTQMNGQLPDHWQPMKSEAGDEQHSAVLRLTPSLPPGFSIDVEWRSPAGSEGPTRGLVISLPGPSTPDSAAGQQEEPQAWSLSLTPATLQNSQIYVLGDVAGPGNRPAGNVLRMPRRLPIDATEGVIRLEHDPDQNLLWVYYLLGEDGEFLPLPRSPFQLPGDELPHTLVLQVTSAADSESKDVASEAGLPIRRVTVRGEPHLYSTKPPLMPLMMAARYQALRSATGWTLDSEPALVARILLLLVNVLPFLIAAALFASLVERYGTGVFSRVVAVAALLLGTMLLPFLFTLNNHTPAAVAVMLALWGILPVLTDGERQPWRFILTGLAAALATTFELPAAAFGLATFLLLVRADPKRTLLYYAPAAALPLVAHFYTTWLVTGGLKPFYAYYGTDLYRYLDRNEPSYWMQPGGIDRATDSFPVYLLHCTLGHHGLFSLTPVFLLTLVTWLRPGWWKSGRLAVVHWLSLGLTVLVLGFYLTRTANYNYGGNTSALRWMLWLVPLQVLSLLPALARCAERRWRQVLVTFLLAGSVFSAAWPVLAVGGPNPWKPSWLFTAMETAGWIDYRDSPPPLEEPLSRRFVELPSSNKFDPPIDGVHSGTDGSWISFAGVDASGRLRTLRLTRIVRNGETWVIIRRQEAGQPAHTVNIQLGEVPWKDGMPPADFVLVVRKGSAKNDSAEPGKTWEELSPDERFAATMLFTGLPKPARYQPLFNRRLRTNLHPARLDCRRAMAQVLHQAPGSNRKLLYRSEVWLSDAVPFGCVQFETTIYDPATGEVLGRERMTAYDASALWFEPGSH